MRHIIPGFYHKKQNIIRVIRYLSCMALIFCFFAVFAPGAECANIGESEYGEVVELKAPVIWSISGEADHDLYEEDQPSVYEPNVGIETKGTVTSLSASWDFEGKVSLEISADNGMNYQKIMNGVPLTDIVSPGNRIKWKAFVEDGSILKKVKISYTDDSGVTGTFGEPELSGFKYRKSVNINNPGGEELYNYQVRVIVSESDDNTADIDCGGKIVSDFNDVRFTAKDGETLLPYYMEDISGNVPNRTAVFWVKVPCIPAEGAEIYVYYSKIAAENNSSPEKVFDIYDDFTSPYVDTDKWEIHADLGGSYKVEDSLLKLNAAGIISGQYEIDDGIMEYKARTDVNTGKEIRAIFRYSENTNLTQLVYSSVYEGAEHAIAVGNIVKENIEKPIIPGIFYYYRVVGNGDKIIFERSRDNFINTEVSVEYEDENGISAGPIGIEAGGGDSGNASYFDWVRVRKFTEIEPEINAVGTEESVDMPEFENVSISEKGDLVFDEEGAFSNNGEYIDLAVSSPYAINTITPYMEASGDEIELDISADGGVTWADNCANGIAYNSSEHFYPGQQMALKVKFTDRSEISKSEVGSIRIVYSMGPIVSSKHIYVSGASSADGMFIRGDTIKVEWDNSVSGDNNPDIENVYCNFSAFGGNSAMEMTDSGPGVNAADKKYGDNIYSASYELPDDIANIGSIYVTAKNSTGSTTRDGHVLTVNTKEEVTAMTQENDATEGTAEEAEETYSENVDMGEITETAQRPGTKLYDVVIKVGDNTSTDPEEDDRASFKHGDVIMITSAGHEWSETEKNSFLILQMYLTPAEKKELLRPETQFTGRLDAAGNWINKTVQKREKKIDLDKFGLSRERLSEKGNVKDKISRVKEIIKGKDLNAEKIME